MEKKNEVKIGFKRRSSMEPKSVFRYGRSNPVEESRLNQYQTFCRRITVCFLNYIKIFGNLNAPCKAQYRRPNFIYNSRGLTPVQQPSHAELLANVQGAQATARVSDLHDRSHQPVSRRDAEWLRSKNLWSLHVSKMLRVTTQRNRRW